MAKHNAVEWCHHTFNPWSSAANWRRPHHWNAQAQCLGIHSRVALPEVFDSAVPDAWRAHLWALLRQTPHLDWLLITTQIGNAARMLPPDWGRGWPNAWLLAKVTTQAEANRHLPELLDTPAAIRGLSCEPLLGPIDLKDALDKIDWVLVGGESDPHARPLNPSWAYSLCEQCQDAEVPFYFTQWGTWAPRGPEHLLDGTLAREADPLCTRWPMTLVEADGMERYMQRVGKQLAGRELWDRTWDEYPHPNVKQLRRSCTAGSILKSSATTRPTW